MNKKIIFVLLILAAACTSPSGRPEDGSVVASYTTAISQDTTFIKDPKEFKDDAMIEETHLRDTTSASGNFILFLRPDSARFERLAKDADSHVYEGDADFGYGIKGTMDSIPMLKRYRNIQVILSVNRFIRINDCKNGPLIIDRDTIDYGIILSGKGKEIKTGYNSIHSGDYLQEVDAYFGMKK